MHWCSTLSLNVEQLFVLQGICLSHNVTRENKPMRGLCALLSASREILELDWKVHVRTYQRATIYLGVMDLVNPHFSRLS